MGRRVRIDGCSRRCENNSVHFIDLLDSCRWHHFKKLVAIEKAVCAAPVFSPDGKWLYFQVETRRASITCTAAARMVQAASNSHQTVGPGGPGKRSSVCQMTANGQLLCTAYDGKQGCVAVLSPDGSAMRLVAPHLGYLYMSAMP